ncbi:class I SAM-dependent methyltransferase [Yeosuana sp. MJ-SS3]|uniref:Class I SAM-dependent methyltransferase n=1 Tax=Gilvirhabdus luticola TaxID=3079858 RepID=A0ABU3U2Q2_9FLAO|nr:class I SAM-dependent methyltransferase [Yeosuana sp. MJ-SS3]MDU8884679.1 class I SAM-dependent methyltransferase [Yeosuana sp. MJ-SS3]
MTNNKQTLSVKDHSVSQEMFQLLYNEDYKMFETFPKPTLENLLQYYQSEDYISHTDSKRNLFERTYQFVKRISLKRKLKLISAYAFSNKTLLDVGCGTGEFLHIAQKNNWHVTGVEPNKKARTIANKKNNDQVFNIDMLSKLHKESFQIITLWHVLEHIYDLNELIKTLESLLIQEGAIIIAVPNYKSYDAGYYKEFWAAYDVPRHLWHFSQESIHKLFNDFNMHVEKVKPMFFDAFYVSLLSEKYKSKKMNLLKAFLVATYSNLKAIKTKEHSSLLYVIRKNAKSN